MAPQTEDFGDVESYLSDSPLEVNPDFPPINESFANAVVVLNIPKIPEAKIPKLTAVLTKIFGRAGTLTKDVGIYMPFDEEKGSTLGFAFIEYETAEDAKKAVEGVNGLQLDKKHTFEVFLYEDAMRLQSVPEEYEEPTPPPFKETPDLNAWRKDSAQRDQFVIRQGKETIVNWSDGGQSEPVVDYDGAREKEGGGTWCEYYTNWSPKGSYLATIVPSKGVILWGGPEFQKIGRFPHSGADVVFFSPCERYLLTCNQRLKDPQAIKIFSIENSSLLRAFPMIQEGMELEPNQPPPSFQWSHDGNYIARMGNDMISVYELPGIKLLDRKSFITDMIKDFQWSPTDNIIAWWGPEHKNTPAHVDLIEIPSRKKLRQKNLFNVSGVRLVWHPDGDFLACKVVRHTKSKKTFYNNIEVFRMRDQGIPIEMLEVKDAVTALAWEPKGTKFAFIHAENPTAPKASVSFYDMVKLEEVSVKKGKKMVKEMQKKKELNLIEKQDGKQCTGLFWSPVGTVIIMAALGENSAGTLEFYDTETKSLTVKEHYRATDVLWDPSGRSVVSAVCQPIGGGSFKFAMDNGYTMWNFQGKQVYSASFESFYQFQWRSRPILLSTEKVQEVKKNIKQYEKEFEKKNKERQRQIKLEETKGKRILRAAFRERVAVLLEFYRSQKADRVALNDGYDSEDENNYVSKFVEVETVVKSNDEVVYLK